MLTKAPLTDSSYTKPVASGDAGAPGTPSDDATGHAHRQVIGYLGLALPIVLVQLVRLRPNPATDQWSANSISAYYWTGAVSVFVGILAGLSIFLLTYRGYDNASQKYDRAAAIVAGVAAAIVALFPMSPPPGITGLPWWSEWINTVHSIAAVTLFSTFAVFSLWLFRKTTPGVPLSADKQRRNAIYLACGIGIIASMVWAVVAKQSQRSIFWPESSALVFFAMSWLVKGKALASIKATATSVTGKVAP